MAIPRLNLLRLRRRSLARAILLALAPLAVSLRLAGFPDVAALHATRWQWLAAPFVCWAMLETFRCLNPRWNLYHAGILILLYSELMILVLVLFLGVYP